MIETQELTMWSKSTTRLLRQTLKFIYLSQNLKNCFKIELIVRKN